MSDFCFDISESGRRKEYLRILGGRTLVVVDNVAKVVTTAVVGFAYAHRIVCEVDIAVIACEMSVEVVESLGSLGRKWLSQKVEGSLQKTIRRVSRLHKEVA